MLTESQKDLILNSLMHDYEAWDRLWHTGEKELEDLKRKKYGNLGPLDGIVMGQYRQEVKKYEDQAIATAWAIQAVQELETKETV